MQKIDKSNMLTYHSEAAEHFRKAAKNAEKITWDYPSPRNIVIAGMGGSAIGGELVKDYTRASAAVPIEISREYKLPAYVDKNTLVFLMSYSGDTEETLSSLLDAINHKCMIFCVSSGGELIRYAKKMSLPHLQVQAGMPPRAALPHMFMPLLESMKKMSLTPRNEEAFSEAINILKLTSEQNGPTKSTIENPAKTMALNIGDAVPVVYGFGLLRSVALRFKQQFNENSKVPAKSEYFSELNHNETMGWEKMRELSKSFAVIFLRDKEEPIEMRSRIETTKNLMRGNIPNILEVWASGKSELSRMLSTCLIGDFASVYLAFLRGVDPTPVETISKMKKEIELNQVKKKILQKLENFTRQ
jgi:glucose/mannose-6-phosphate isomerase